ncbi:MAG: hypothetical protein ACT4OD_03965 [Candidatus Nitrosotenuis sp.]
MIFSKKEKTIIVYTIEECPSCKKESKRKFKENDCLFTPGSKCDSCKIPTNISKIFGQSIE